MTYYKTVDEAITALHGDNPPRWPSDRNRRLWLFEDSYIPSSINKSALQDDGFGWCGLHTVEGSGHVSASGHHRSKKRAFYMKECKPWAVKLQVWDAEKALKTAKRYWSSYNKEEKAELEEVLVKALLKAINPKKAREESKFAQWSERAKTAVQRAKEEYMRQLQADMLVAGIVDHPEFNLAA